MTEHGPRWADTLEESARAVLPPPVWEYVSTGAGEGVTAAEAAAVWRAVRLRPHVLRDVTSVRTERALLGTSYSMPVGIAPTSLQRAVHDEGECAMARAARAAGVPLVVSSAAGHRFADIGAVGAPWWLQLYAGPDRSVADPVVVKALEAGASAIVLTVDTPVPGRKYRPPESAWETLDLSWHRCNHPVTDPGSDWAADLTAADIGRLTGLYGVPVIVKGVLRADDARSAVDAGARAVWVSTHGGRQLDRVISSAEALSSVCAEVGDDAEVYVDGGIRSGLDVAVALGLGADAAFLGRPPLYALALGGDAGVERLMTELRGELEEAMRLSGSPVLSALREVVGDGVRRREASWR